MANMLDSDIVVSEFENSTTTCLFGFYGIWTIVGYLMPYPFYTNKQFCFEQFSLA